MTMTKFMGASFIALTLSLSACGNKTETGDSSTTEQGMVDAKPTLGTFGVALENMNTSVKPGDDFFAYVNGGWLDTMEIPADKSSYGNFTKLRDLSEDRVKLIIEEAAETDAPLGSNEQKIGDLYAAFMDQEQIEERGLAPIQADLDRIRSLSSKTELTKFMAEPGIPVSSPIGYWVSPDAKNPTEYIVYMTQSGLGMGNRDYYFDEGEEADAKRDAYVKFLTIMLSEAGLDNAEARADKVMAFETALAEHHWDNVKRRNRSLTYNKMTMDELEAYAPGIEYDVMLDASLLGDQDTFVVREKDAFKGIAKVMADTDLDVLKDYMTKSYMSSMASYLPKRIDDASFDFYSRTMRGTEQQRDRWKRGVSVINGQMGEIVGKVYVDKYFKPEAKAQMLELVENLRATFKEGIDNLEWMGEDTKVQAQDKLAKFNPKIGYPDKWTDYSELQIDRDDLVGSIKSASIWSWKDEISKLGGPIDKDEWGMNPQTVNAYYRPDLNEIVFPAAILQAPFFDPAADPAVNYGGIGAVIGHEMGHGFDDQGRKTDGDGKQRDWWTKEDGEAFEARSKALVEQYNQFEPLPGVFVNGQLGLGENIGDLTGITMAYKAYKKSLNGEEAPVIDGFTGDQRFFLAYGQIWARKFRDEAMKTQVKNGPHSPGKYRANGIVRNFGPWYDAFDVQPGDALYIAPEDRVKIW
ncbi:M13 family metallopeptidase [Litorimonas sp. RW-G-Af-16]|uniref:M13 family metallopeptidase n=1 Tax=Litorimonas sp. RW-G-Af-16 TaxID=3241168 RepID=UPI00390CB14A